MLPSGPDFDAIVRALETLAPADGSNTHCFEVRGLTQYRGKTLYGYFKDPILAANAICQRDESSIAGWYATMNPVHPDCYLRQPDVIVSAPSGSGTSDPEILYRTELLIDIDPKRISGISSTDAQHDFAMEIAKSIEKHLLAYGFPNPCVVDSGNGVHLRYKLYRGDFPNDDETKRLLQTVLQILADKFNGDGIEIDRKVFNASRICRIPGTWARKGQNVPSNPHRLCTQLIPFDTFGDLRRETVQKFVSSNGVTIKGPDPKRAIFEYPEDEKPWRNLNKVARERIHEWVPHIFHGICRQYGDGYRISSADLGRDLEEDICILPKSIKDFGVHDLGDETEGRRTPISLIAEFRTDGNKYEAAEMLSACLNVPITEFADKPLPASPKFFATEVPMQVAEEPITMPPSLLGGSYKPFAKAKTFDPEILFKPKIIRPALINNMFLMNTHVVLSGPPKVGKTTLSYMMMLHILFGMPLFGEEVTKSKILYLALEERDWRMQDKVAGLAKTAHDEWGMSQEEFIEGFRDRFMYFNLGSKTDDEGNQYRLPAGPEGAHHIREVIREDTSEPTVVCIEPANRFHVESATLDLNMREYEMVETINDIVQEKEYQSAILSIKHDRKSPPGGNRAGNIYDNMSGSMAQQGAVEGQLQLYVPDHYSFEGTAWIIAQSRDFGKFQIPLESKNEVWQRIPKDRAITFKEYREQEDASRLGMTGAKPKDPKLPGKVMFALEQNKDGLTLKDLRINLNCDSEQILRRTLDKLLADGQVTEAAERRGNAVVFVLTPPASMPNNGLPDLI